MVFFLDTQSRFFSQTLPNEGLCTTPFGFRTYFSRRCHSQTYKAISTGAVFIRSGGVHPSVACVDGTYIYIYKSTNFSFSRRSFSLHKHRPLVKPMMVVTTSGYIVSVLGPYLSDSKNNDAGIHNHMIKKNAEETGYTMVTPSLLIVALGTVLMFNPILAFGWRCHVSLEVQSNTQPRNRTVPC